MQRKTDTTGRGEQATESTDPDAQRVTVITAWIGAVTGVVALGLTAFSTFFGDRPNLEMVATVSTQDVNAQAVGVRASLNNDGVGGATIRKAALVLDGVVVSETRTFMRDATQLGNRLAAFGGSDAGLQDMPFDVGPRSARTVALVFGAPPPPAGVCASATDSMDRFACARATCRTVSTRCQKLRGLRLRLTVSPGDEEEDPVELRGSQFALGSKWFPRAVVRNGRVIGIRLVQLGRHGSLPTEVLLLEVWRHNSELDHPPLRVERPVIGEAPTVYPLGRLPRGRYAWTFRRGGTIVLGGFLDTPCRPNCKFGLDDVLPGATSGAAAGP